MPDADYCAQLVREADKDRFLATLFAPADRRPALYALYAFNIEIARVGEVVHEPLAGEVRLQWWSEALSGSREGEAQANPVAAALRDAMARFDLPEAPLLDLVDARVADLYDEPLVTFTELETYAERTSSVLILQAMRILGTDAAPRAAELARHAGIAHAMAALLRALPAHAARGKLYLPVDMTQRHGVDRQQVLAGHGSSQLRAALAEMRLRARWHLRAVKDAVAEAPSAAVPALLPVAPTGALLARMERPNYDPFAPPELAPWRRQWLIWRAAHVGLKRVFG